MVRALAAEVVWLRLLRPRAAAFVAGLEFKQQRALCRLPEPLVAAGIPVRQTRRAKTVC